MQFALFFAVVLSLSWALMPHQRLWRPFILAASYYFYAAADWHYAFLLAGSTIVNQTAAAVIARQGNAKLRKAVLVATISLDLGALGVFKYLDFFSDSVSSSLGLSLGLLHLVLPVGLSFYTFQAISYIVDVHRRRTPPATRSTTPSTRPPSPTSSPAPASAPRSSSRSWPARATPTASPPPAPSA